MNVFVTGATGFVGTALLRRLNQESYHLRAAVRPGWRGERLPSTVETVVAPSLSETSDYFRVLQGIDVVVHLAARVHVMADDAVDPLAEFRKVNVAGTERLARQAAAAGVRRLLFLSSVKVNGEGSMRPYREEDPPAPEDPYGVSKREAEELLRRVAAETGLDVVIIRPPLVYGPGVKANFLRLLETVRRGTPLPFSSINNKRSFIGLENLVDAIATCTAHPLAAGRTYLVSDGDDVSTPELVRKIASACDAPARLFPVPVPFMRLGGLLAGKRKAVDRLVGSLTVDTTKIRRELGWRPPFSMEQGLAETADWFRKLPLDSLLRKKQQK
jgi:nucleoside-diphosphate-sugar epimerase